eukprot:m51a1_g10056 putative phosphate abc transporter substrate-binding protein (1290) ;mRNA; f:64611-69951
MVHKKAIQGMALALALCCATLSVGAAGSTEAAAVRVFGSPIGVRYLNTDPIENLQFFPSRVDACITALQAGFAHIALTEENAASELAGSGEAKTWDQVGVNSNTVVTIVWTRDVVRKSVIETALRKMGINGTWSANSIPAVAEANIAYDSEVISTVATTPNSMGFALVTEKLPDGVAVASIQNLVGEFTVPTNDSMSAAVEAIGSSPWAKGTADTVDQRAAGAYPLTLVTWAVIWKSFEATENTQDQCELIRLAIKGLNNALHFGVAIASYAATPLVFQQCSVSCLLEVNATVTSTTSGAGATVPDFLYQTMAEQYVALTGMFFNYTGTGPVADEKELLSGSIDCAGTDQLQKWESENKDLVTFPTVAGAVVLPFNLPGMVDLVLDRTVLPKIFSGEIHVWNDKQLVDLQNAENGRRLMRINRSIFVVHRNESTGTTNIFTTALSKMSADWESKYGHGPLLDWAVDKTDCNGVPCGIGAYGRDGVATKVAQTPGSIGYLIMDISTLYLLPYATLRNKAGKIVVPSATSLETALLDFTGVIAGDVEDGPGEKSWPLIGYTYVIMKNKSEKCQQTINLLRFWLWALTSDAAKSMTKEGGMWPLSNVTLPAVLEILKSIKCEDSNAIIVAYIVPPLVFVFVVVIVVVSVILIRLRENSDLILKREELTLDAEVGKGRYGTIYLGTWRGGQVAIRQIKRTPEQTEEAVDYAKQRDGFKKIRAIRHPRCVMIMGYCTTPSELLIVTEYMTHGSLKHLLCQKDKTIDMGTRRAIAKDILEGLSFLHTCRPPIVHGNLSTQAVLFDSKGGAKVDLCSSSVAGLNLHVDKSVTTATDIYCFGLILAELFNPTKASSSSDTGLTSSVNTSSPSVLSDLQGIPPQIMQLIKECCQSEARLRPSVEDVMYKWSMMELDEYRFQTMTSPSASSQAHEVELSNVVESPMSQNNCPLSSSYNVSHLSLQQAQQGSFAQLAAAAGPLSDVPPTYDQAVSSEAPTSKQDKDGKDVHREFKGSIFDDGALAVIEIITTPARKLVTKVIVPKGHHANPSAAAGAEYRSDDIAIGARLKLPGMDADFVVTKIDGLNATMAAMAGKTGTIKVASGNVYAACGPVKATPEALVVLEHARNKLAERGARNIINIGRSFRICDDSGDGRIDREEFHKAAFQYGLVRTEPDYELLYKCFDADGNGFIDYEEFLRAIRGEMNEFRKELVMEAFKKLDSNKNGVIEADDLTKMYSVLSGEWTEEKAINEFLTSFDTIEKDGKVTFEEFLEYYAVVSASIDLDETFELLMRNAWRI